MSRPKEKGQQGSGAEVHTYKHLGTELTPGWKGGMADARAKVVMRCTQVIKLIGRIPVLTNEQMSAMMSLAVDGIVGYYGRSAKFNGSSRKANAGDPCIRAPGIDADRQSDLRPRNVLRRGPGGEVD